MKKQAIVWTSIVVLVVACFLIGYSLRRVLFYEAPASPAIQETATTPETIKPTYFHPLTGAVLEKPLEKIPTVYGVMIDHSSEAWPQSGIEKAFLVIEAPVEANIPRLLAFFSTETDVPKIGPVRSARPYFIDWAREFDAIYAHVGGSNDALDKLQAVQTQTGDIFNVDEFANASTFYRASNRLAPHNAYTSSKLIANYLESAKGQKKLEPDYQPFLFQPPATDVPEKPVNVSLDFSATAYHVDWKFDTEKKRYTRYQSGLPFVTESGAITANNIAVVVTQMQVLDDVGRKKIVTLGEGDARVYQDGREIKARWKKPTESDRLRFYTEAGDEIPMNGGVTWIEVIPSMELIKTN